MEFRFGMAGELSAEMTAGTNSAIMLILLVLILVPYVCVVLSVAFCSTVIFLNVFDGLTSLLERSVGTSRIYNSMIQRIYHELMSTGFVSIMLSFYQAAVAGSEKRDKVFTTLDFCGYFIFCVSIFHVIHGIYIIIISLSSAKQYDEYHRTPVSRILTEWADMNKNPTFITKVKLYLMNYLYIPGFTLRSKAEFKIFYSLFRHTYMLPKHFHYGEYLSGCFERYSLKIVTIGTTGWICMILICLANMLRVKFGSVYTWRCGSFEHTEQHDEFDDDEFHRPRLSNRCQRLQLQLFFGCGLLINAFVFIIFLLGRMYTLRLLAEAGVTELNDFDSYLALEERIKQEKKKVLASASKNGGNSADGMMVHRQTIDMESFKSNYAKRKNSESEAKDRMRSPSVENALSSALKTVSAKIGHGESNGGDKEDQVTNVEQVDDNIPLDRRTAVVSPAPDGTKSASRDHKPRRKNRMTAIANRKTVLNRNSTIGRVARMAQSDVSVSKSCVAQFRAMKMKASLEAQLRDGRTGSKSKKLKAMFRNKSRSFKSVRPSNGQAEFKYSEDFSFIYLFGSPLLYFRAVETCIVLNSLYLSFWLLNFITVAHVMTNNDENNEHWPEWVWQPILVGPLLFSVPVIGQIVKTASLLAAIAELEIDVMGLIIEGMEQKATLSDDIRKSILEGFDKTFNRKCNEVTCRELFNAHDDQQQGALSFDQVRNLLINLNLHVSDQRFESLMELLDFNRDGLLDYDEWCSFMFGTSNRHNVSSNMENSTKQGEDTGGNGTIENNNAGLPTLGENDGQYIYGGDTSSDFNLEKSLASEEDNAVYEVEKC